MKFHHIGIAVESIDSGFAFYNSLISELQWMETVDDFDLGVSVKFGQDHRGVLYELISPLNPTSPISIFLKKSSNMIHHIAYLVSDFEKSVYDLRRIHCIPLGEAKPALAFDGKRVMFFLTRIRTIIEIIEE